MNINGTKDYNASIEDRISMLQSMIEPYSDRITVLPFLVEDINRFAKQLFEIHKGKELYCFIGQDVLETIPEEALKENFYNWVLIPRASFNNKLSNDLKFIILRLKYVSYVSSTIARNLISSGEIENAPLDFRVADFISRNNLYKSLPAAFTEIQIKYYKKAFSLFLKELKSSFPEIDSNIDPPEFNIYQSGFVWLDKFANWFIKEYNLNYKEGLFVREFSKNLEIEFITVDKKGLHKITSNRKKTLINRCSHFFVNLYQKQIFPN